MQDKLIQEIDTIFNPRAVAFFGVSGLTNRLGNLMLFSFLDCGYPGILYPVNKNETSIMNQTCYPCLEDIPGPVDLAIISVHPDRVEKVIDECLDKGVKGAVIFTSGFGETGEEGRKRQQDIVARARAGGMRIIGPNCMGLYSSQSKIAFFPGMPGEKGSVAFLSQSGSLANMLGLFAAERGLSFSRMVSVGNAADLDVTDFLQYLGEDNDTDVIACYMEGVSDGRRFLEVAGSVSLKKPILLWKVGDTEGGKRGVRSHTGSMAGSGLLWDAAIKQAGIVRVENLVELVGFITAFTRPCMPTGRNIVIISGPGGAAISAADACEREGLVLAEPGEETVRELAGIIPEFGTSTSNPIDLSLESSFDVTLYPGAVEICGRDSNVDIILAIVTVLRKEIVEGLIRAKNAINKPVAIITLPEHSTFSGSMSSLFGTVQKEEYPGILRQLYEAGISVHATEQEAARALSSLCFYADHVSALKRHKK